MMLLALDWLVKGGEVKVLVEQWGEEDDGG